MRKFTKIGLRMSFLFVLLLIPLLICGADLLPPLPFSCNNLTESYWSEFNFDVDTAEEVAAKVSRLWGIDEEDLDSYGDMDGNVAQLRWLSIRLNRPFGFYSAWFQGEKLKKIAVEWVPLPVPTLSRTIECLGAPESYIVYYGFAAEGNNINLDLIYPDKGIVVSYNSLFTVFFMPELPEAFHSNMRIRDVAVVAPGTVEQMLRAVYSVGNVGGGYVHNACLSKPWPGSIEAMEIVPLSEFTKCQDRDTATE